ncbi:Golgin subfamily A member 5 [Harpegnathos saltator]|uniref:Golgin subfamily A member 5 n=1 Tax=Harpegnathos saltator TaxID=610380 RepID=E2B8N9_HARSA|nr:Golgin subfamily A member 5 [Harpegnathos saltator]
MAWLSDLADKAENLLNKIDKNTAAVLNKDKYEMSHSHLSEVTWLSPESGLNEDASKVSLLESSNRISYIGPTLNLTSLDLLNVSAPKDDALFTYLNTPEPSPKRTTESLKSPSTTSSLLVEHPTDDTDSELSIHSDRISPTPTHISIDVLDDKDAQTDAELCTLDYHQKEIIMLNEKLKAFEAEKLEQSKQIMDLQFIIDRSRQELNSIRSELEQHKARALKTLQEKEKLIAELQNNASTAMDEATVMELNQLKQERDSVREENQQMCHQLKMLREELINADLNLEKIKQKSVETNLQNQEILASERRRRLDAEEDVRLRSEEIRSLKDELLTERNGFSLQLQKQDSEISKLRLQLSASAIPSNEMDLRLTSLTKTLVLKQQALECLTTERNALRLQLEKLEHEYRNAVGNLRRNISYNNMNDTDDAKAQVPTFLMETPFDTSVTRRVKRAYSSLDAISVRTGVFLRRYPLARILVLIYMALLQFWVLVVLLSQSPEAH